MSSRIAILAYLQLVSIFFLAGQNLIPNEGFEYCRKPINDWMPTSYDFNNHMINWFSPNFGSPDILQHNQLERMKRERAYYNIASYSPRSGEVMIGLKLFGCSGRNHCKEYLQVKLKEPLQKKTLYYFETWTKPINSSIKINNIGLLLSMNRIDITSTGIYAYTPQVNSEEVIYAESHNDWIKISDTIYTDSSYQFLTLGNFFLDEQTTRITEKSEISNAYYLFDDMLLERVVNNDPIPVSAVINPRNIHFETDSYQLRVESHSELNRLVYFLNEHFDKQIEIEGHTDNVGTADYNQALSQQRANSVLEYLTAQGISINRIVAIGKGSTQPLTNNHSEENRRINRRVEIRFTN